MVGSQTVTQRKRRASASSSWMYSLYSLSVVAATIRISPRASTDLKMLAASDGAPSAEPAPTMVCASSTNRIRFGRSFSSRITFWIRSSNMPRSIVPATMLFICRLTTWQSRSRTGTLSGSNSMRRASPSAIAVLPTPGSPISITELARSRWQRISSTCWISLSRPNTGGSLSCRASRFRLVAKCFRNGGSSKRFFSRSSRSSMSRMRAVSRDTSTSGSTPWRRRIDTGTPCVSSNTAENRSAASIVWRPARLAWCSASLKTSLVAGETRSSRPANDGIICRCSSIA